MPVMKRPEGIIQAILTEVQTSIPVCKAAREVEEASDDDTELARL
jgi:hypothetical protein